MDLQERRDYDVTRYRERRLQLINLLGGICVDCESDVDLEFDHVDRNTKTFDIGSNMFRPMTLLLIEVKKCVLRCKKCHVVKSYRERSVDHGGGVSGKRNCKCILCKTRKAEYMKDYKLRKRA